MIAVCPEIYKTHKYAEWVECTNFEICVWCYCTWSNYQALERWRSLCIYVYIYIYICVCVCVYVYVCVCVYVYVCVCVYVYVCVCMYMYVCVCVMHNYIYMCVCVCVCDAWRNGRLIFIKISLNEVVTLRMTVLIYFEV